MFAQLTTNSRKNQIQSQIKAREEIRQKKCKPLVPFLGKDSQSNSDSNSINREVITNDFKCVQDLFQ